MRAGLVYGSYAVGIAAIAALMEWQTNTPRYLEFGHDVDLRPAEYGVVLALFTILTVAFVVLVKGKPPPLAQFDDRAAAPPSLSLAGCAVFAFLASLVVARLVLDAFPNSGDEYAYLVQSMEYLHGRLWADQPPLGDFFQQFQLRIVNGKWVSMYPPGWPAVLALGEGLGLPAYAVDPLIAAATAVVFYFLARRYVTAGTALLAVGSLILSAFFIFNEASFFSHAAIALAGIATALAGHRFLERPSVAPGLAAGLSLGFVVVTRPDSAVLLSIPLAAQIAASWSWRRYLCSTWIVLGALPGVILLLAYFHAVTGNALLPVPNWSAPGQERLMLPADLPENLTLKLLIWRIWLLMIWTSPLLVIATPIAFLQCCWKRKLDFTDFYAVVTIAFFVFYPGTGGNQYGPRYYYMAFPFMILTIAKAVDPLLADRNSGWQRVCLHLIAAHWTAQTVILPFRAVHEHRVVVQRQDMYREVERTGIANAVVLVASSTAPLRPMRPADLARNGTTLDRPVIYALDLKGRIDELRALLPDRSFFRYERKRGWVAGSLQELPAPPKAGL